MLCIIPNKRSCKFNCHWLWRTVNAFKKKVLGQNEQGWGTVTQDAVLGIDREHWEDHEAYGFYSQGEKIAVSGF